MRVRHEYRLISRTASKDLVKRGTDTELWRCSCGSEFRNEDDAAEHAANACAEGKSS